MRRKFLSIFLAAAFGLTLGFGFVFAAPALADGHDVKAERFISSLADKAVKALTDLSVPRKERAERFRALLNDHFAVKAIGRWVLGRHWRKASKAEQVEYLKLFEELLVVTYLDRFTKYSGETLSVSTSVLHGKNDIVVSSAIIRPNGEPPLKVDWRVRAKGDSYKIVDVMVEGISMGQTQRSEFSSVIRQKGGVVQGLLEELRKRANFDA